MKHFPTLLRHELRSLLVAPSTYVAAIIFLVLMGLFYVAVLADFSQGPRQQTPAQAFLELFWVPAFFLIPILTMRSLAEEQRSGTLRTLMTTPVTSASVVLAKTGAAYFFYCLLWALTLLFPVIAAGTFESDVITPHLFDTASLLGGYGFIALSGLLFIAVGIFASSLTRSPLVAATLTFSILFILILGIPALKSQVGDWTTWMGNTMEYFELFQHLADFSRGVVDTRPFFLYGSTTFLFLGMSMLVVEART